MALHLKIGLTRLRYPTSKNKMEIKIILGGNLASHVLHECQNNNIQFVLLLPNATHILQPQDVSFFARIKKSLKEILLVLKFENKGFVPKSQFPFLSNLLLRTHRCCIEKCWDYVAIFHSMQCTNILRGENGVLKKQSTTEPEIG
ncbi:hypothetical protein JTB14_017763 [Gonioctena quinquepunctata]|nr:hypothetical protein JTB14_017763 [Gonioctena quinquepunctata]